MFSDFQSNEKGKKEINSIINTICRSGEISIKGKILQSIQISCQICKEINYSLSEYLIKKIMTQHKLAKGAWKLSAAGCECIRQMTN